MKTCKRIASLVAILSLCLISNPIWGAPAGGGGGFRGGGGGGGGHPGGGGGGGGAMHAAGGGGGGGAAVHSGSAGGGGAANFHSASTFSHTSSASTFAPATNRTPTFTHPTTNLNATNFSSGIGTVHTATGTGSTFHSAAGSTFHSATGATGAAVHNSSTFSGAKFGAASGSTYHAATVHPGGTTFGKVGVAGGNSAFHNQALVHPINAHVGNFHQAYIGNHAIHVAPMGYHPSYFYHPFYHGPWTGHAYGWGWGWGPGWGIGFGGPGWGLGFGSGFGYGGYYPYGPYGYWGRPLGWGFGGWGLGGWMYSSGYYPYYNPYYAPVINQPIVYNYSNPIPVTAAMPTVAGADVPADDSVEAPAPVADNPDFDAARDAFRQGDYPAALASIDAAIAKVPGDAVLHEFRGLVLFAMQDYKQAAAVVHSVLAMGPGWDWTTMSSLYADPDLYTQQLRALEDYTLAKPKAADAHFLLAYHYMICSHNEAAAGQLMQVTRLMPSDRLAGELLKMVQGPPQQGPSPEPPDAGAPPTQTAGAGPDANAPQLPDIDKSQLPGTWRAAREDGSKFQLTLADDGNFTWKFAPPKQKPQEFGGTWSTEGPVLILERKEGGGALAGTVTFDGDGKFNFRAVGGPPEDKGLDFSQ